MFRLFVLLIAASGHSSASLNFVQVYYNLTNPSLHSKWLNKEHQHISKLLIKLLSEVLTSLRLSHIVTVNFCQADVLINFDDAFLDASKNFSVISVWPYYQEEFCFIYATSKKLTIRQSMKKSSAHHDGIYTYMPLLITSVYHMLVLRFRLKKSIFDAITRAPLYALQLHLSSAMPNFNRYPLDKYIDEEFFFSNVLFISFFIDSSSLACFTTTLLQCLYTLLIFRLYARFPSTFQKRTKTGL